MKNITQLLLALLMTASFSSAADQSLYQVPIRDIDGKETSLKEHSGKVMLVVNVASKCGYTSQYEGLEELWQKYKDKGLVILGFPSNDFGGQEPGTEAQIKEFCASKFNVTFPMYSKVGVKGSDQHPLYAILTGPNSPFPGPVKWNFGKFLIGRNGEIIARYDSGTKPNSPELVKAVESTLDSGK